MNIDDLYRMLRTEHSQLQGIVDTAPDPMLVLDESLCVVSANRAFFAKFQVDRFDTIGQRLYDLGNGQWDIPELRVALGSIIPKAAALVDFRVDHEFPTLGLRSMLVTARTLYHSDNVSRTMLLSILDATTRVRQEAHSQLLLDEMHHRIRNLLSVAQSLARQSTTEGRTVAEFRDAFLARFSNLIRSSELAFSTRPGTGLRSLVKATLAPFSDGGTETVLTGEDFDPGPSILVSLGLVLHELATNAAKYGALSVPGGQVRIDWARDGAGLHMNWTEQGGPPTAEPSHRGYGTKLINSTICYNLGGTQETHFGPNGFSFDLFIPLQEQDVPVKSTAGGERDHAGDGTRR